MMPHTRPRKRSFSAKNIVPGESKGVHALKHWSMLTNNSVYNPFNHASLLESLKTWDF